MASEKNISLHRCPVGESGGRVRLPGSLRDRRRALCKQSVISVW